MGGQSLAAEKKGGRYFGGVLETGAEVRPGVLTMAPDGSMIPKILRRARTGILQPPTLPSSPAIHPASLLPCLGYLWRATSCRAGRESVEWPETRGKEVGKHHFSLLLRPMPAPPVVFSQSAGFLQLMVLVGSYPPSFMA